MTAGVLERETADLLSVAVTLSMVATPLLLAIEEMVAPRPVLSRAFDSLPENDGHVVIAGFGRVGQIVARVLLAKRIPLTALDSDPEQVDAVRKFGARIFYGDASRPEILEAAQTAKARAFVLAIDNVEASLRTARMVRQRYPHVPIFARSRHRRHTHQLMDLGVEVIRRETFLSSLDLTREVLRGLGVTERDVRFAVDTFRDQDRHRLYEDYKHYTNEEKMQKSAQTSRPGAGGAVRPGRSRAGQGEQGQIRQGQGTSRARKSRRCRGLRGDHRPGLGGADGIGGGADWLREGAKASSWA